MSFAHAVVNNHKEIIPFISQTAAEKITSTKPNMFKKLSCVLTTAPPLIAVAVMCWLSVRESYTTYTDKLAVDAELVKIGTLAQVVGELGIERGIFCLQYTVQRFSNDNMTIFISERSEEQMNLTDNVIRSVEDTTGETLHIAVSSIRVNVLRLMEENAVDGCNQAIVLYEKLITNLNSKILQMSSKMNTSNVVSFALTLFVKNYWELVRARGVNVLTENHDEKDIIEFTSSLLLAKNYLKTATNSHITLTMVYDIISAQSSHFDTENKIHDMTRRMLQPTKYGRINITDERPALYWFDITAGHLFSLTTLSSYAWTETTKLVKRALKVATDRLWLHMTAAGLTLSVCLLIAMIHVRRVRLMWHSKDVVAKEIAKLHREIKTEKHKAELLFTLTKPVLTHVANECRCGAGVAVGVAALTRKLRQMNE